MATKKEIENFINKITPIVFDICKTRGFSEIAALTCIAQAACESNYGKSAIMANAHAYFGIKATKTWVNTAKYGGLVYSAKTKECYDGKNLTTITDTFRAYKSDEDSINDYFDLMQLHRYRKMFEAESVREAVTIIKNGGYATSPNYIDTICKFYDECAIYFDTTKNEHRTYTVKKGDSLWTISKNILGNPLRWYEIAELNNIKGNFIFAGQILKMPEE